jgi:hypothetical protein
MSNSQYEDSSNEFNFFKDSKLKKEIVKNRKWIIILNSLAFLSLFSFTLNGLYTVKKVAESQYQQNIQEEQTVITYNLESIAEHVKEVGVSRIYVNKTIQFDLVEKEMPNIKSLDELINDIKKNLPKEDEKRATEGLTSIKNYQEKFDAKGLKVRKIIFTSTPELEELLKSPTIRVIR